MRCLDSRNHQGRGLTRRGMRCVALLAMVAALWGADAAEAADPYRDQVVPFLTTYCVRCHDAKTKRGELDLTRLTGDRILDDFRQWEHVITFVKKEEMPPAKAKQPSARERAAILGTLEKLLRDEARKLAGDPGVVPPRRLSNAEYDYSIRDLTGVDIQPARSFPVDPSSGEGFSNTGEALTMSPSLFKKYYAAAELVSEHALLTTEGLRFAPHPVVTFADRQKYYEQAILRFYQARAVDLTKYLTTLWLYRHRPAARRSATVEEWARDAGVSPKYARHLWDALEGTTKDRFLMRWLRGRWQALPTPKQADGASADEVQGAVRALANDLQRLSRELCPPETPAIVANAGNGPIEHLERRRRTAESRDTFDTSTLQEQKVKLEYGRVTEQAGIRVVIEVLDFDTTNAEGLVVIEGQFSTNQSTTDGTRKWSLRELVERADPVLATKLRFGVHPQGGRLGRDAFVLAVGAKGTKLEIELPTKLFPLRGKGSVTLTASCRLDPMRPGVAAVRITDGRDGGQATTALRPLFSAKHPLVGEYEASAAAFCRLFPNRFFYVDDTRGLSAGFHLIEGFFRDDRPLCRSVLSEAENRELDGLWRELYFVTGIWEKLLRGFVFFERSERNFLKHADFDSFKEEDPNLVKEETLVRFQEVYLRRSRVTLSGEALAKHPITIFFEDIRNGLRNHAAMRERAEKLYRADLLHFAERAYRRPLSDEERGKVERFYETVSRDPDHGVEAAVRASLVRLLVSPHFCMRYTATPSGDSVAALPDLALASRLSYFLWSGPPDEELLGLAKAGKLSDPVALRQQVRRMARDAKVSRFALEFFGQWLGYRDFLSQETVSRQAFPQFDDALKQAMFEEPTRLITHLVREGKPITELINGDTTLVNRRLARHYEVPFSGEDWQRISGLRAKGRGGVMGMAVFLTKNSQPQRTSPVKRGFWVVHKLLGEHIPPPPPNVAVLPAKETETAGKTIRELLRQHVEEASCARCHQRFDPVGLAMEGFDPIGRTRSKDLAGRPVDNLVSLPSGKDARGVPAFADYLAEQRKQEFTRTLCLKMLGYALGRSVQLSDQPLLEAMQSALEKNEYRLDVLFEIVASSPQFRTQRCKDFTPSRFRADSSPRGER